MCLYTYIAYKHLPCVFDVYTYVCVCNYVHTYMYVHVRVYALWLSLSQEVCSAHATEENLESVMCSLDTKEFAIPNSKNYCT